MIFLQKKLRAGGKSSRQEWWKSVEKRGMEEIRRKVEGKSVRKCTEARGNRWRRTGEKMKRVLIGEMKKG
jgi:hypothetical protein